MPVIAPAWGHTARALFAFHGGEGLGRARKFKTARALAAAWEEYKAWCDDRQAMTHGFSSKNSEFVSKKLKRSVTYTIEGFCAWAGISRAAFYETYGKQFPDTFTCMREECEIDAWMKFELGIVDSRLAPLWMSRYGYGAKAESLPTAPQEDDPITKSLKEAASAVAQAD